jgi:hypothetical protein
VVFQQPISLRFSDKFMLYFVGLPQQPAAVRLAFFDISVEVPAYIIHKQLYSVSWRTETRPTRDPSGATVIGG